MGLKHEKIEVENLVKHSLPLSASDVELHAFFWRLLLRLPSCYYSLKEQLRLRWGALATLLSTGIEPVSFED